MLKMGRSAPAAAYQPLLVASGDEGSNLPIHPASSSMSMHNNFLEAQQRNSEKLYLPKITLYSSLHSCRVQGYRYFLYFWGQRFNLVIALD